MATTTVMPAYPTGTLVALLRSVYVTEPTRRALQERLARSRVDTPRFFDGIEFSMLQAVCRRLLQPSDNALQLDIAGSIDSAFADGDSDGRRYDTMPP